MADEEDVERTHHKKVLKTSIKKLCVRLFILFLFTAFGGFLFRWAEGMREAEYKCGVKKVRRDFLDALWTGSQSSYMKEEDWKSLARRRLLKFEDELHVAFEAGINSYSGLKSWSFLNSVFYALTIMTTIGYGHITPATSLGKILTIIYALIGIPAFTIIMGDAAKVLTRALKLFLTRKNPKGMIIDEDFNLPLKTGLLCLFVYSTIGAVFFYLWESDWGILGSFYFIFVSTSTIGFGDLVPSHPIIAVLFSLYFLFGLALTAAVINLIQEKMDGVMNTLTTKIADVFAVSTEFPTTHHHYRVESESDYLKED